MRNTYIIVGLILFTFNKLYAQDNINNTYLNSAEQLLIGKPGLSLGGYGEVHYIQPIKNNQFNEGTLDVHRIVMFLGYNFNKKTQFVSEIEFEYAKELWVEQAFLQHNLHKYIQFRAGLLLIPMGIINEYHEPTTFNGVERPIIDNKIAPSTWREIGAGFAGALPMIQMKYQAYIVNGLSSYNNGAVFSGSKTLREGRQKGSKSFIYQANFSGKIEYYGIHGLNLGLSGYFGPSQSNLYKNLSKDSLHLIARADSSVINIGMYGFDARYQHAGLQLRGQFYLTSLGNTKQYNQFTGKPGKPNDLGKTMIGYYVEAAYNIFQHYEETNYKLYPFLRYQFYNSHHKASIINNAYNNTIFTSGITFHLTKGAVIKADIDWAKSKNLDQYNKKFNAGFGVMF